MITNLEFTIQHDSPKPSIGFIVGGVTHAVPVDEAKALYRELGACIDYLRRYSANYRVEQRIALQGRPIDDLELSVRTFNCLKSAELSTIGQMADYGVSELRKIKHMGRKSVNEIRKVFDNICVDLEP